MCPPISEFPAADMTNQVSMRKLLNFPFVGRQPEVSFKHVWPIFRAWTIKQIRPCFLIQPAIIKRSVCLPDKIGLLWPAARTQPFPPRASIEPWGRFHRARIAPCNFFMANCRVEGIGHSRLQAVEINIDENPISPRVDSGKRPGKQVR